MIRYLDYYADNYHLFPVHGNRVGKGKIMAQSLDEAVFGIHLLRALFYMKDRVTEERKAYWRDHLFLPMAYFLAPQCNRIHNISVWIQCFLCITGIMFENHQILRNAIRGPYGLKRQLRCGLTKDLFWFEGSLHYHYFVLEALTYLCEVVKVNKSGKWDTLIKTMTEMYRVPMKISFDGYKIPSLNDG